MKNPLSLPVVLVAGIAVLAGVALPFLVYAQNTQQRRVVDTDKKYVLFIHAGPASPTGDVVRRIAPRTRKERISGARSG